MQISQHINEETRYNQYLEDAPARHMYVSMEHFAKATAKALAERFCIGPEQAKATLQAST